MKKLIIGLLIVSCTASNDEKLHQQSVETHDLAIKVGEHVHEKIQRIAAYAKNVDDTLKTMLEDSVESLQQDYDFWESTIVEVPGHEHDHHEGHNHDHTPPSDLNPEMILEIQRDMRDQIVKLNIRSQRILDTLEKEDKNEPIEEKEKASSYGA